MEHDRANCVMCEKSYDMDDLLVDTYTFDDECTYICSKCEFLRSDEEDV